MLISFALKFFSLHRRDFYPYLSLGEDVCVSRQERVYNITSLGGGCHEVTGGGISTFHPLLNF
jgi:hypothetical protein